MLIEREHTPQGRVGESLHPGAEAIFRTLGMIDRVDAAGFLRHRGHWTENVRTDARTFVPFGRDAGGDWRGYQAWRPTLDAMLQQRAEEAGVDVRRGVSAGDVRRHRGRRVTGIDTAPAPCAQPWSSMARVTRTGWRVASASRVRPHRRASWPATATCARRVGRSTLTHNSRSTTSAGRGSPPCGQACCNGRAWRPRPACGRSPGDTRHVRTHRSRSRGRRHLAHRQRSCRTWLAHRRRRRLGARSIVVAWRAQGVNVRNMCRAHRSDGHRYTRTRDSGERTVHRLAQTLVRQRSRRAESSRRPQGADHRRVARQCVARQCVARQCVARRCAPVAPHASPPFTAL